MNTLPKMKKLNLKATGIFADLLDKLTGESLILEVAGEPPLCLVEGTGGSGYKAYSLTQSHQEGRFTITDHHMDFWVIDCRIRPLDHGLLIVYAISDQQDAEGIDETSISYSGNVVIVKKELQAQQAREAADWLIFLKTAGFLKAVPKKTHC